MPVEIKDEDGPLFLGLDASTQALKASLLDEILSVVEEIEIRFDRDLPQYGTTGGTRTDNDGSGIVSSPVLMIVEAFDLLFDKIKSAAWPVNRICAVSAAGQQHASVYWSDAARKALSSIDSQKRLCDQLSNAFSRMDVPNWQDSSTLKECEDLEASIGGPSRLAELTGSKAHTRFTASQILRFKRQNHQEYQDTWRISLVSSFMTTLLCLDGEVKPIDESDACGMNMWTMNTSQRGWSRKILEYIGGSSEGATDLATKLGKVASDAGSIAGRIGKWHVNRYGFHPGCLVTPGAGDNPATFLSFVMRENEALISLGTSDTILISTSSYAPDPQHHIFFHPAQIVAPSATDDVCQAQRAGMPSMRYFNMLVYKNGSLAREHVRDKYFGKDWADFDASVRAGFPTGSDDVVSRFAFWWLKREIIPTNAEGTVRYERSKSSKDMTIVTEFEDVRRNAHAMLASQLLGYRYRTEAILNSRGSRFNISRIYATGGASANSTICQMIADVFGCEVCKPVQFNKQKGEWQDAHHNACSVAAAYKAAWAWNRHSAKDEAGPLQSFDDFARKMAQKRMVQHVSLWDENTDVTPDGVKVIARPKADRAEAYKKSLEVWKQCEEMALTFTQGR